MAVYHHGARVREESTVIATPKTNEAGLHVIFGTAPINMAEDPGAAVNQLIIAETYEEAVKKLGYSDNYSDYTLCQAVDAYFKIFAVSPVVFCNVLDPTKHFRENEEKKYKVTDGQAVVDVKGILTDTLEVKKEETVLAEETDYVTTFAEKGELIITLLSNGAGAGAETLTVKSKSIGPSAVTEMDIIGGVDAVTGKETGIELVRRVYPKFGNFPGLLLAPGWSHKKNVAAVLGTKCREINGVFTCECVVDLDTEIAGKYTECRKLKEDCGLNSEHMILTWPKLAVGNQIYYYSAIYGAAVSCADINNDSVPGLSPSNRLLNVTAAVLEGGTEINLDRPEANTLNSHGIVTVINDGNLRTWGNNTAAYPDVTDVKDRWICCRRIFSWWANRFVVTCSEKVDNPANYRLIETIVDEENIKGNSYVQQGKVAGMKMSYNREDNTVDDLLDGRIQVEQHLAPYTPAEDILNVLSFDPTLLENALGGN